MTFQYPNGMKFRPKQTTVFDNHQTIFSNRGMSLEDDLNETNQYYLVNQIAVIHKKPTPLQIVQVDYPKRSAAVIREAYFRQPSTTDYNGVFRGRHIDFEAKETKNKTSFPLKNFHDHQIEHMKNVLNQGGICFAILKFSTNNEIYLLDAKHLIDYYEGQQTNRKSIPKKDIENLGHLIEQGYQPRIHYLKIVDHVYF